jgi:hypothetical protein
MANIFTRKSSMADDIASMRKRFAALVAKRADAKQAFDTAVASREEHLLIGNVDDERTNEKHQARVDSAASKVSGLDSAITAMTLQVDDLEARLRSEQEEAERNRVAGEIEKNLAAVEQQIGPWLASTRTFIATLATLEGVSFEVNQVALFLSKIVGECELALSVVLPDMHRHAEAICAGAMATPNYPKPEPEVVELQANVPTPTSAGEPVELWFAVKPLKYRDLSGHQRTVLRWSDVELPKRPVAALHVPLPEHPSFRAGSVALCDPAASEKWHRTADVLKTVV